MESSFTYCSQWVIADCFFLTLVMSNTDVIISCILTNWAGKKRKNSQKYNTVLMSRIFLEKNEPLWVWFLGHEEKWGINSKLGALSSLTCSTYTKIGTIQRRLAWPLRKDDTQIREAFLILNHYWHWNDTVIAESTFECRIYIRKLERYSEREESPSPEILQSTFEKKDWGLVSQGHLGKHVQVCLVQWPDGTLVWVVTACTVCGWGS